MHVREDEDTQSWWTGEGLGQLLRSRVKIWTPAYNTGTQSQ